MAKKPRQAATKRRMAQPKGPGGDEAPAGAKAPAQTPATALGEVVADDAGSIQKSGSAKGHDPGQVAATAEDRTVAEGPTRSGARGPGEGSTGTAGPAEPAVLEIELSVPVIQTSEIPGYAFSHVESQLDRQQGMALRLLHDGLRRRFARLKNGAYVTSGAGAVRFLLEAVAEGSEAAGEPGRG